MIPSPRSIETGILRLHVNKNLDWVDQGLNQAFSSNDGVRTQEFTVYFKNIFAQPPKVHLGLTNFDFDVSARINLEVLVVTTTNFTLRVGTWSNARLNSLNIEWIAF